LLCFAVLFIRPFEKTGRIMGTCAAGGIQSICPLNNFNSFHYIINFVKMFVGKIISAKFDDQLDPMKNFGVMALELAKINLVRSVT